MEATPVLDKGYVRLTQSSFRKNVTGNELSIVNAARASFMKESGELSDRDRKLIAFLAEHGHTGPFRHVVVSFEVKAPLMVARQWFKYRVGWEHGPDTAELLGVSIPDEMAEAFWNFMRAIEWVPQGDDQGFSDLMYTRNEASRRYVTLEPEWYIPGPGEWRGTPENKKQGSGGPLPENVGKGFTELMQEEIGRGMLSYNLAMEAGIAPELARGFLPSMYFLYTVWRWSGSLQAVAHFIHQRAVLEGAQSEIRDYAQAVYKELKKDFPDTLARLIQEG